MNMFLNTITGAGLIFHPKMPVEVWMFLQSVSLLLNIAVIFNAIFSAREIYAAVSLIAKERKADIVSTIFLVLNYLFMIYHAWTFSCLVMWWMQGNWVWLFVGLYLHALLVAGMAFWIYKREGKSNLKVQRFISPRFLIACKNLYQTLRA